MRDPYEILGVQKMRARRRSKAPSAGLPRNCIPTPTSRTKKAATKFAELNAAYEIVGDEDKRKAFDRGEIDAEGKPRFQGFGGRGGAAGPGGFGQEGGFETFTWGPDGFQRGGGAGPAAASRRRRHRGHSEGDVRRRRRPAARRRSQFEPEDIRLGGRGRDVTGVGRPSRCRRQRTGTTRRVQLPTGKEIDVKNSGRSRRRPDHPAEGAGACPAPGGAAGDALITVSIAPHPLFKRDGADLRLELPITLYEAVLGGKVRVPTLDGAVELAIPPGTSCGRTFRLKGKGLPAKDGAGDLYATVHIVLPERGDAELEELMRKWRDGSPTIRAAI